MGRSFPFSPGGCSGDCGCDNRPCYALTTCDGEFIYTRTDLSAFVGHAITIEGDDTVYSVLAVSNSHCANETQDAVVDEDLGETDYCCNFDLTVRRVSEDGKLHLVPEKSPGIFDIVLSGDPTTGTYKLAVTMPPQFGDLDGGGITADIDYDATESEVLSALEAVSSHFSGAITISTEFSSGTNRTYRVTAPGIIGFDVSESTNATDGDLVVNVIRPANSHFNTANKIEFTYYDECGIIDSYQDDENYQAIIYRDDGCYRRYVQMGSVTENQISWFTPSGTLTFLFSPTGFGASATANPWNGGSGIIVLMDGIPINGFGVYGYTVTLPGYNWATTGFAGYWDSVPVDAPETATSYNCERINVPTHHLPDCLQINVTGSIDTGDADCSLCDEIADEVTLHEVATEGNYHACKTRDCFEDETGFHWTMLEYRANFGTTFPEPHIPFNSRLNFSFSEYRETSGTGLFSCGTPTSSEEKNGDDNSGASWKTENQAPMYLLTSWTLVDDTGPTGVPGCSGTVDAELTANAVECTGGSGCCDDGVETSSFAQDVIDCCSEETITVEYKGRFEGGFEADGRCYQIVSSPYVPAETTTVIAIGQLDGLIDDCDGCTSNCIVCATGYNLAVIDVILGGLEPLSFPGEADHPGITQFLNDFLYNRNYGVGKDRDNECFSSDDHPFFTPWVYFDDENATGFPGYRGHWRIGIAWQMFLVGDAPQFVCQVTLYQNTLGGAAAYTTEYIKVLGIGQRFDCDGSESYDAAVNGSPAAGGLSDGIDWVPIGDQCAL